MKETDYLNIINQTLTDSSLLGDDCAYLEELGICITQDSLVEDVHFKLSYTTPFELGQKAVNVNLSDLAAAGAVPLYITVSLSLSKEVDESFVREFYQGIDAAASKYNVKVAGGDLTGSDKVFVSICAIGKKDNEVKVSRKFAKFGDFVVTTGVHGDSAGGLKLLMQGRSEPDVLIKKHLVPSVQSEKSLELMNAAKLTGIKELAVMDTSDGLGDAIYKLSKESGLYFNIDFSSIPISRELKETFKENYIDLALWGGEDFELLFCAPKELFDILDKTKFFKIGVVTDVPFSKCPKNEFYTEYETKSYKHFEVEND